MSRYARFGVGAQGVLATKGGIGTLAGMGARHRERREPRRGSNSSVAHAVEVQAVRKARTQVLVMVLLALATLTGYWGVTRCEYTNYDDPLLIVENPRVVAGLTPQGLWWALTDARLEYWHPVTWWSHMLDWELFGSRAGWHHGVSLGLHVANTLLLFAVLRRMTGAVWRSGMVAGLFALHPMHVESVAWLAERKDLLSGLFFLLTLWAYACYAEGRRKNAECRMQTAQSILHPPSSGFYLLSLAFFTLGLMSKPMVVTLPFVLLLLDFWPLRRFGPSTLNPQPSTHTPLQHSSTPFLRLLREKLPFFALTAASCVMTYYWAARSGNTLSAEAEPWGARLANLPVSYMRYLGKLFWPADFAVVYPIGAPWAWWAVCLAVLVLLLITLFVWRRARSAPHGLVGWLIFVGMLFPTIRLVQQAFQSIADRYTYLPSIGLFLAVVWCVGGLSGGRRGRRVWLSAAGWIVLGLCLLWTRQQVGYWRNSETLFRRALAVTEHNYFAHTSLGEALNARGQVDEADRHYREAIRLKPDHADAWNNLGVVLVRQGHNDEAIRHYQQAIRLKPDHVNAHNNLANALVRNGQLDQAIGEYLEAIRLNPGDANAHYNLGITLGMQGRTDDAIRQYQQALGLRPDFASAHFNLGVALMRTRRVEEAIVEFRETLRLQPDHPDARQHLQAALAARSAPPVRPAPAPSP